MTPILHKFLSCFFLLFLLISACASPEDKKGRFFLKANEKIKENDLNGAVELYSEALKIDSQYIDALYNRALVYQSLNRLDQAISDFTSIMQSTLGIMKPYCKGD